MATPEPTTHIITSVVTQTPTAAESGVSGITVTFTRTLSGSLPHLTTFFTPPADCTNGIWTSNTTSYGTLICTRAFTSSCYPPSFSETAAEAFSPGACPYGYNLGGAYTNAAQPSVTSRICCPGGMSFNGFGKTCEGLRSGPASVLFDNRTVRLNDTFTALGQEISVAWAASDLTAFTPVSAPVLQISIATSTSNNEPTLAPDQPSPDGLTQTAKIGIGIGIACFVLILVMVAGLVVSRRLRRARSTTHTNDAGAEVASGKHELKAELSGDGGLQEAGGNDILAEADHMNMRHELEGDWHGFEAHGPRSPTVTERVGPEIK